MLLGPVSAVNNRVPAVPDAELSVEERQTQELRRLREQVAAYASLASQLVQGNAQLQALAHDLPQISAKAIPALIIRRGDSSNWRHTIYLNRGSAHGVKPGYLVTVGRVVAGRVLSASSKVAAVTLLSDPDLTLPVSIFPLQAVASANVAATAIARGILRGNGGASPRLPSLSLANVNTTTGITKGMLVVTNDAAGQVPPGLLVGTVEAVREKGMFLDIEVRSVLDLELMDTVLVIPHERPTLDDTARLLAAGKHLDAKKG